MNQQTLDNRLAYLDTFIYSTFNNSILYNAMKIYGYSDEILQEKASMLEILKELDAKKNKEHGEYFGATETINKRFQKLRSKYIAHVRMARVIFKSSPIEEDILGLKGTRSQNFLPLIEQANQFYTNALNSETIIGELSKFSLSREVLQEYRGKVLELMQLKADQKRERAEAKESTRQRDEMLRALESWVSDYKVFAKIAMEDHPSYLKVLGVKMD